LILGWLPCHAQNHFSTLPPEGIEVGGWIGRQIKEDAANGWVTICNRMSHQGLLGWDVDTLTPIPYHMPYQILSKGRYYWNNSVPYYQTMIDRIGEYSEGEFGGHWLDTVFRMGWIGDVPGYRELGRQAVKDILDSLDESGYIGVNSPATRFTGQNTLPWGGNWEGEVGGIFEILNAFLNYYRYTGDERVLKAVIKAADLTLEKTRGREMWGDEGWLAPLGMIELYRVTRNKLYLDRARLMVDVRLKGDPKTGTGLPVLVMREGDRIQGDAPMIGDLLLSMVGLYEVTGDTDMLTKARTLSEHVERYAMQAHGVPTGQGEQLVPSSPWANTEVCVIVWYSMAWMEMLKATGEAHYADLVEKAAWNALPGQRSKDGAVSPYTARPNQLFATRPTTVYGARTFIECCHGNGGRLLPVLAEHLVLSTPEGDFVVPFYNNSRFRSNSPKAGKVEIIQETDYPFSENVRITVRPERHPATFTVRLRVPEWCKGALVKINGQGVPVQARDSWIDLTRSWGVNDVVSLTLPMEVRVKIDKDGLAVVERGPLVYSLPVEGRRIEVDQWGSFEKLVTSESKWNYALVLDKANPAKSFSFTELKVPEKTDVWEQPRVAMEVEAVRIPEWKFDKDPALLVPNSTADIAEPPFPARPISAKGPKEKIRLVPYGCTILRMTQMPVVDSGN
jgi:hypothetical protein